MALWYKQLFKVETYAYNWDFMVFVMMTFTEMVWSTASLRSCEYSNFDELCMHKIHYKTMILYLNYKNNVYKVENLNEKSGRWSKILKNLTT